MSQLLYHRLTRTSEDISPFDKAILQVIEDGRAAYEPVALDYSITANYDEQESLSN